MKEKILLLHGALGTKGQFNPLKEVLAKEFDIYTMDFAGHGHHESSKAFTMDLFIENVVDFLQENQIDKINIFGYSMGGYVALNLAKNHPDLVEKIVTLGTKFNWTKESAEKEIRMLNPEKIEEKVPAFANKLAKDHAANDWKNVLHKTADMMLGLGNGKRLTKEDLSQISHPVLIGIGSLDRMVSQEESEESASTLPNGRLHVFADFQHPIEKIDVIQLHSTITQFLQQ